MTVLKFLVVLLYYLFLCVWVFRLYVFLGNRIVWYPGSQKWVLNPIELELLKLATVWVLAIDPGSSGNQ